MLKELDLKTLHISDALLERWLEAEFDKIDADHSNEISLDEFTQ
jgi:hypothetical protein